MRILPRLGRADDDDVDTVPLEEIPSPALNAEMERRSRLREDTQPASASQPTTEDWYWGRRGSSGSEEDYFWRRLSDNWYQKDVVPSVYLELHNQVFEAWNANPIANYIVEIGVNFVLGDGIMPRAKNRKVQKVVDSFWNDPDNRMDLRIYDLCQELSLYGEIFVRFFVNEFTGDVKIVTLDPSMVDQIESDPENIEHEIRIHRRPIGPSATIPGQPAMPLATEQANYEGKWLAVPEECVHFSVNKVSNAKRGKSDLATLLPWLRRYKDWLIDRVRINKYKGAFLWDITLAGADRKTVEGKMQEYNRPPEPGSVVVHNDGETWAAVQPHIDAGDVEADGRAIKLMIAMGAGIPEHYLASGENSNRATAAEMALPTIKKYKRRQEYFGHIVRLILSRVVEEKQKRGLLPAGIDTTITIAFPDIDTDDNLALGTAAKFTAQALNIAKANGWVSDETAARLFFESLGEDIDAPGEVAAAGATAQPLEPTRLPATRGSIREADVDPGQAMIAYLIPATTAQALAIPGGEAPEDLHVTLAFIPAVDDPEALAAALADFARTQPPLRGRVSGIGQFLTPGGDTEAGREAITYASVDVPGLAELHTQLLDAINDFSPSRLHGFTPHITLQYLPPSANRTNVGDTPTAPTTPDLTIDTLHLCYDQNRTQIPIHLTGPTPKTPAKPTTATLADAA